MTWRPGPDLKGEVLNNTYSLPGQKCLLLDFPQLLMNIFPSIFHSLKLFFFKLVHKCAKIVGTTTVEWIYFERGGGATWGLMLSGGNKILILSSHYESLKRYEIFLLLDFWGLPIYIFLQPFSITGGRVNLAPVKISPQNSYLSSNYSPTYLFF